MFISIIIACYNGSRFISKALEHIKCQQYKDFEIIIVDDLSTDNSVAIIENFIKNNPHIRTTLIKNQRNLGVSPTKGVGISNASGEYVVINDQDDWMDVGYLQALYNCASQSKADKVSTYVRLVDDDGKEVSIRKYHQGTTKWAENSTHGTMFKKSILTENGLNYSINRYVTDDLYFQMCFNANCGSYAVVPGVYYNIHRRLDSETGIGTVNLDKALNSVYNTCIECSPIYMNLTDEDKPYAKHILLRCYFVPILGYTYSCKLNELIKYNRTISEYYNTYYPGLFSIKQNALFWKNGDGTLARFAVRFCFITKKIKLFPLFLAIFKLLSPMLTHRL